MKNLSIFFVTCLHKMFMLTLAILLSVNLLQAQCPPGILTIYGQSELDSFGENFPHCTSLEGIQINGPIYDLSPLSNVQSAILLIIVGTELQSLNGLENLQNLSILFVANSSLQNLNGLENIAELNVLWIMMNPELTDISALNNVEIIPNPEFVGEMQPLIILQNENLSMCHSAMTCNFLQNDPQTHVRIIEQNAPGCASEIEILEQCNQEEIECEHPGILNLINLSTNSANISWTDSEEPAQWEVFLTLSGQDLNPGSAILTSTPFIDFTDLASNTTYDVYVRAVCGDNDFSEMAMSSFTTLPMESDGRTCGLQLADISVEFESPFVVWFHVQNAPIDQTYDLTAGNPGFTPLHPNFGMTNKLMPYRRNSMHSYKSYEFYMRVVDANGAECKWVGPISFTTPSVGSVASKTVLYPNPATKIVNIEGINATHVAVYTANGQFMRSEDIENNSFDISTLPTGTYSILITESDGKVTSQQLIKK